jgi:hypothetical protein
MHNGIVSLWDLYFSGKFSLLQLLKVFQRFLKSGLKLFRQFLNPFSNAFVEPYDIATSNTGMNFSWKVVFLVKHEYFLALGTPWPKFDGEPLL